MGVFGVIHTLACAGLTPLERRHELSEWEQSARRALFT